MATENTEIEELKPIQFGKGCQMRLFIDHSKPIGDLNHNWIQITYDGLPGSCPMSNPPHWHRHYDEVMRVLSGRIIFNINGKEIPAGPEDGTIIIPRMQVHSFRMIEGVAVTFTEHTVPSGEFKARFFQDAFLPGGQVEPWDPGFLGMARASWDGDTIMAVTGGRVKWLEALLTMICGILARPFVRPMLEAVVTKEE